MGRSAGDPLTFRSTGEDLPLAEPGARVLGGGGGSGMSSCLPERPWIERGDSGELGEPGLIEL